MTESDSLQGCPVKGNEAASTNEKQENQLKTQEKKLFHCDCCQTQQQVAQTGFITSVLWCTPNPTADCPEQPPPADSAWSRGEQQTVSRGPFKLQPFCDLEGKPTTD